MKKIIAILFAPVLLAGCLSDTTIRKVTYFKPVYKTTAEVRAGIKTGTPMALAAPGKIFYHNGYLYLNEMYRGIHIIDVRNINAPKNTAFIKIPGSVDLAVRGNILYADMYTDLVAIDISDPMRTKTTHFETGVFPESYYVGFWRGDSGRIAADWVRVDTTIKDEDYGMFMKDAITTMPGIRGAMSNSAGGVSNGTGGSMARFGLMRDRLYTVSWSDLRVFNTSIPEKPSFIKEINLQNGTIETIFPYNNFLFLGSMTGMYVFDATDKDNPVQKSKFEHARVCDPVIAEGNLAYVTLRSGNECVGFTNQLEVVDITEVTKPSLVKTYPMTNPHGLAKDGNILMICEGRDGLRILDASNPRDIKNLSLLKGFESFDVIALNGVAVVSAKEGLYFINYQDPSKPTITHSFVIND